MRLTQNLRTQIIQKAIEATFKARKDALLAHEPILAKKVYDYALEKYAPDFKDVWAEAPLKIVEAMNSVNFKLGFESVCLPLPRTIPLVRCIGRYTGDMFIIGERDIIFTEVKTWHEATKQLDDEIAQLKADLRNALYSFTTVNALIASWPEIAAFVPQNPAKKPAPCPAITFENLNARIIYPAKKPAVEV